MAKMLTRTTRRERFLHWTHLVSTAVLFLTGASWYWPALAGIWGGYAVTAIVHRVAAAVFIIVPVCMIVTNPRGLGEFMSDLFHWTMQDVKWMMLFPLYIFKNKTTKMPKTEGKYNAGQKFDGSLTVGLCLLLAISGAIWIFFPGISVKYMDILGWMHRIAAVLLLVFLAGHIFLGSGAFKPYRGMARTMFGDGKIDYDKAEHIWPDWIEELESGSEKH